MRISVSDIDVYLKYMADENEKMELKDVLRRLRKEEPRPWYMDAGNAFHKLLEHARVGDIKLAEQDGFKFTFDLETGLALPMVTELKGELEIQTSVGPVVLVGKVDAFDDAVRDYKLSSWFDLTKYIDSYQWRCYLLMFHSRRFVYDVFTYDEVKPEKGKTPTELIVNGHEQIEMFDYPNMEADVVRTVDQFARFVDEYMPERRDPDRNWQSEPRLDQQLRRVA